MTLIIAHRGASGYKPEMTIPAYELALQQNVDGFETDVRLTKDLELVGIHDRKTGRVANSDLIISKTTLKQGSSRARHLPRMRWSARRQRTLAVVPGIAQGSTVLSEPENVYINKMF
jgi:glycerophosphoryl diester phosphodiesterase